MEPWVQTVITVICAVLASSGFWAFIMNRSNKKSMLAKMVLGIAHDRILFLANQYLSRPNGGYITQAEYENLHEYLYEPYIKSGGDGTVARVMQDVERLPTVENHPVGK